MVEKDDSIVPWDGILGLVICFLPLPPSLRTGQTPVNAAPPGRTGLATTPLRRQSPAPMKTLSALLSLALGLSLIPATFAADKKPAPAAKPAQSAAAKPAPAANALDENNLVGLLITRSTGGFINLKVEDGHFTMKFYDAEKKETSANVSHAAIKYRKGKSTHRHSLNRSPDEKMLISLTPVDRPYIFKTVHVALFDEDEDNAPEVYTVNFKQLAAGEPDSVPVDEMTPEQLQKIKK